MISTHLSTCTSSVVSPLSVKKTQKNPDKNWGQFHHLHIFSYIIYPGQMNWNDGSGLNVQWRSCLSIICLREKIATPPTDYAVSIMALHMLLCGMNSGMTVSLYTSWGFIFWLMYSSDHYSQSTALAWLSHWAVIAKLESAKFPHNISLPSLWHWCHSFREGWKNTHLISNFLSSASG